MEEILLKYVYDYSFNYKYGDEDLIREIYYFLFNYYNIEEKYFNFYNDVNYHSLASYNPSLQLLSFNLEKIYNYSEKNNIYFRSKLDGFIYCNLYILYIIFHELDHILQFQLQKHLENNNETSDILKLLDYSTLYINKRIRNKMDCYDVDVKKYNKYHDYFPTERLSRLRAYKKILELLKLDPTFNESFNALYSYDYYNMMNLGYENDKSPCEEFLSRIDHSEFWKSFSFFDENSRKLLKKVKEKYSLEERLLYGFPIDIFESNDIHKKFLKSRLEIEGRYE